MLNNFTSCSRNRQRLIIKNRLDEFEVPIAFDAEDGEEIVGIATVLIDASGEYTWRRERAVAIVGYYAEGPLSGLLFTTDFMPEDLDLFPAAH